MALKAKLKLFIIIKEVHQMFITFESMGLLATSSKILIAVELL